MDDLVTFASNGNDARGYLVVPESGSGPGVIVVQEWWGLDSGIKEMDDRLGAAGFVALAPDLYHGELAGHTEMDKAGELMTSLPADRAARDMSGAVDFLAEHDATTGDGIGVMGFCMGGLLTFVLAALRPDKIKAAVRSTASRKVTISPTTRQLKQRSKVTWPNTTISSRPRLLEHSKQSCRHSAKT
jgi:carboxymethylenebutenolidase